MAIIGLGYVGLPLATVFARVGYQVIGIDVDPRKVDAIKEEHSYIEDVPSSLVHHFVATEHLTATTDYATLVDCDIVSICVPTPLRKTGDPGISYIVNVADQIATYLHSDMLIVLENTTTTEVIQSRRGSNGTNLEVSQDFFL